jgi:hypothetical protein
MIYYYNARVLKFEQLANATSLLTVDFTPSDGSKSNSSRPPIRATSKSWMGAGVEGFAACENIAQNKNLIRNCKFQNFVARQIYCNILFA